MYYALYLLCISLLIKVLFYIIINIASNLEETAEFLLIVDLDLALDEETQLLITQYRLKKEYKSLDLKYHIEHFILC